MDKINKHLFNTTTFQNKTLSLMKLGNRLQISNIFMWQFLSTLQLSMNRDLAWKPLSKLWQTPQLQKFAIYLSLKQPETQEYGDSEDCQRL
jgi:hypothetical protein